MYSSDALNWRFSEMTRWATSATGTSTTAARAYRPVSASLGHVTSQRTEAILSATETRSGRIRAYLAALRHRVG
jgi:hypothetical protein